MSTPRSLLRLSLPASPAMLGLILAVGTTGSSRAQQAAGGSANQQSAAYQASVTQDGLKRDVAAVRAELVRVRDQMRQLMPEDAGSVDKAIAQMDSLSREEMERVIQTLRGASKPEGLTGQAKALADALKDQGTISASLKRLAINLDARQSMEAVANDLSGLLLRQVAVKNELLRITGREHKDQTPGSLHNREQEQFQAANSDQISITQDVKLLLQRLEKISQTLTGDAQEKYAKAVGVARENKLVEMADSAQALTSTGPFDQANVSQGKVATTLVGMEQILSTSRTEERLTALQDQLKKLVDQETTLRDLVAGFHERQSVDADTKRLQYALSDQIAVLGYELQGLNSQASGDLVAAQDSTEKASLNYIRMWEERADAQANTRTAVAQLTDAVNVLNKQIAALPTSAPTNVAQLDSALAALAKDAAQAATAAKLQAMQAASGTPPTPENKKALQAQVDALQQRALPLSPDAARDISDAAADLQKADPASQQDAAQQLAQAAQQLAQQQAILEGRTPQQQALAQATAQANQAAQDLAQAQPGLQSTQTSADAVNQMNAAKQDIAQAQRTAAQAGAPPEATQALAEAAQDIAQAQQDGAATNLTQAQAAAKAAQQALSKAGQAMAAAKQASQQQAAGGMMMASKAGNDPGKRQENANGVAQGQGNGGGGKTGDGLAGAGAAGSLLEPVSGLTAQDRAAVSQLQTEKPPAEFAAEVQQYYKNIADGAGL